MQGIIDFFSAIGDVIVAVIDFVISFFKDLVFAVQLVLKFLSQIPSFFSWLPAPVIALLVSLFAIVALYKLLGREG